MEQHPYRWPGSPRLPTRPVPDVSLELHRHPGPASGQPRRADTHPRGEAPRGSPGPGRLQSPGGAAGRRRDGDAAPGSLVSPRGGPGRRPARPGPALSGPRGAARSGGRDATGRGGTGGRARPDSGGKCHDSTRPRRRGGTATRHGWVGAAAALPPLRPPFPALRHPPALGAGPPPGAAPVPVPERAGSPERRPRRGAVSRGSGGRDPGAIPARGRSVRWGGQ